MRDLNKIMNECARRVNRMKEGSKGQLWWAAVFHHAAWEWWEGQKSKNAGRESVLNEHVESHKKAHKEIVRLYNEKSSVKIIGAGMKDSRPIQFYDDGAWDWCDEIDQFTNHPEMIGGAK